MEHFQIPRLWKVIIGAPSLCVIHNGISPLAGKTGLLHGWTRMHHCWPKIYVHAKQSLTRHDRNNMSNSQQPLSVQNSQGHSQRGWSHSLTDPAALEDEIFPIGWPAELKFLFPGTGVQELEKWAPGNLCACCWPLLLLQGHSCCLTLPCDARRHSQQVAGHLNFKEGQPSPCVQSHPKQHYHYGHQPRFAKNLSPRHLPEDTEENLKGMVGLPNCRQCFTH